jgi:hypothetical protein
MATRVILLVALSSFLFNGIVRANDPKLPGSDVKIEDAVSKSTAIFVGVIDTTGFVSEKNDQMGATVTNVEGIFGLAPVSPWEVLVLFTVSNVAGEALPKDGSSYVFCVLKNEKNDAKIGPDKFTAIKLFPATDSNIAMVENLVSKLPKE